MTTAQNNQATNADRVTAPISSSQAINQGDLVKISSNLAVPVNGATDTVFGMSDETNPTSSLLDTVTRIQVIRPSRVTVFLVLKNGDTANFNDSLYLTGSNAQEVTTSSGGGATKVGACRELSAFAGDGTSRLRVELGA